MHKLTKWALVCLFVVNGVSLSWAKPQTHRRVLRIEYAARGRFESVRVLIDKKSGKKGKYKPYKKGTITKAGKYTVGFRLQTRHWYRISLRRGKQKSMPREIYLLDGKKPKVLRFFAPSKKL